MRKTGSRLVALFLALVLTFGDYGQILAYASGIGESGAELAVDTEDGNGESVGTEDSGAEIAGISSEAVESSATADASVQSVSGDSYTKGATVVISGSCGTNVTYALYNNGVLVISGTGDMKDYTLSNVKNVPWYSRRSSVETVVVEDGVTSIGTYAFYACSNLAKAVISGTITTVNTSAFNQTGFKATGAKITAGPAGGGYDYEFGWTKSIPEDAFYEMGLVSVVLPDTITEIGESAFARTELTEITLPSALKSIGDSAFYCCESLSKVSFPANLESIGDTAFYKCILSGSISLKNVDSIGDSAFYECTGLKAVYLAEEMTEIGNSAFRGCSALKNLTMPKTLESLGYDFIRDTAITSLTLYNVSGITRTSSVSGGNSYPFTHAEALEEVIFGEGTTSICSYLLAGGCMSDVELPDTLTEIQSYAFYGTELTSIEIPDSVTSIGIYAFYYCSSLEEAVLPTGLKYVSQGLFCRCTSLKNIDIPAGVRGICGYAFSGCTSLKTISLPTKVATVGIDQYAFYGCSSLKNVYFAGSKAEASDIYISDTENSCLTNATWTYNSPLAAQDDGYEEEYDETATYYTVTYDAKGVADIPSQSVKEGDFAPRPSGVSRAEYTLTWYNGDEEWNFFTEVTDDLHLTAVWEDEEQVYTNSAGKQYAVLSSGNYELKYTGQTFFCETQKVYETLVSCDWSNYSDAFSMVSSSANTAYFTAKESGQHSITAVVTTSYTIYSSYYASGYSTVYDTSTYIFSYYIADLVTAVSVSQKSISMDVGESVPLDYSTTPSGNWARTVSGFYAKSSNTSVVTIGSDMILTAVGEGTATITIGTDKGLTASCQVTVGSVDLEECEVTLSSASYTYDGKAKTPAVTVTYGGKTLTKGTDYSVSYSNNTNAGTATVTVTGKGEYTGTKTVNFTIKKASQTVKAAAASSSVTRGSTTTITASTTGDGAISYASGDTAIATVSSAGKVTAKAMGTVKITVTAAATGNYNKGTATVTITVAPGKCSVSYVCNTMDGLKAAWNEVEGATGYYIYRRNTDGTYNSAPTATVMGSATTTWTDPQVLTGGQDYTYKVAAYYKDSAGTIILGASGTTKTCKYLKGGEVTGVANTSSGLKVTWTRVTGANGYYIYRKSGSGSYTKVKTTSGTSTLSWTDTSSHTSGTDYSYKVVPYFKNSSGVITEGFSKTTKTAKYLSGGVVSSVKNVTSGMTVTWSKVTGANGYYIYRKSGSGSYTLVKTTSGTSTLSWTDTSSHTSGTDYSYKVVPYFKNSAGVITEGFSKTTKTAKYLSGGVVSSLQNTSGGVKVTWSKVTGANGYYVYRKASDGSYTLVKTITGGSTLNWTDTSSLTKGKSYTYKVVPFFKNSAGVITEGFSKTTKTIKYSK